MTSVSTSNPASATAESKPVRWLSIAARTFGLLFFAAAALLTLSVVSLYIGMVGSAWGYRASLLCEAAIVVGTLVLWRGARRLDPALLTSPHWLPAGLLLVLGTRLIAAALLDGPQISDFLAYHKLAVAATQGGPWFSDRPMGYPLMLAALYLVLGPQHWIGVALNVGLAVLTGAVIYSWVRRLASNEAATLALLAYALTPAQIMMVAVQGSEVPYAAAFACMVLALSLVVWQPQQTARWALLGGALLGLSQYIRPTSLAVVPAALIYLAIATPGGPARATRAALAFLAAFLLALAPAGHWNWQAQHKLSLSTSTYGGWSLLVGTNQASNGYWNVQDDRWLDAFPKAERETRAKQEAYRRVTSDPLGFAALAGRKFGYMWASDDYGVFWTLDVLPGANKQLVTALYLLCQLGYASILVFACVGAATLRRNNMPYLFLLGALMLLVGAHTFLEVQARYHFYWTPLFAGLAGVGALRCWQALYREAPMPRWRR